MKICDIYSADKPSKYGYCSIIPDVATAGKLNAYLTSLGIDGVSSVEDLHCTLMYDVKNSASLADIEIIGKPTFEYNDIILKDIKVLSEFCVVIEMESLQISDRFKELSKHMKHSYDDLLIHMTIVKTDKAEEVCKLLASRKDELFELLQGIVFSNERFEPIKD